MTDYHQAVLLEESINALNIKPNGIYVDLTFGGGSHSRQILEQLNEKGKLIAFDKDEDATDNDIDDERFMLINHDFKYMRNFLSYLGQVPVSGILADLGVSSHQFNVAERGFSFRFEGPLDMRMDRKSNVSAFDVIQNYSADQLKKIFGIYGEVKNAAELANKIVVERKSRNLSETVDFLELVEEARHKNDKPKKYYSQVFQALRIEVNGELDNLKSILEQSLEVLDQKGRLAIIAYHSLEDRMVKKFFRAGNLEGKVEKDLFGRSKSPIHEVSRKPIKPTEKEIDINPRARSARLRVAEKI